MTAETHKVDVIVSREGVVLPEQGLILQDVMLVWRDAEKHTPPKARPLWLIVENGGDVDIECGEFLAGGVYPAGWFLIGCETPIGRDYRVMMFAEVPALPPLPEVVA